MAAPDQPDTSVFAALDAYTFTRLIEEVLDQDPGAIASLRTVAPLRRRLLVHVRAHATDQLLHASIQARWPELTEACLACPDFHPDYRRCLSAEPFYIAQMSHPRLAPVEKEGMIASKGFTECIKLVVKSALAAGAEFSLVSLIIAGAQAGNTELATYALDARPVRGWGLEDAIYAACERGRMATVKALLKRPAPADGFQCECITAAIYSGYGEILQALLDSGSFNIGEYAHLLLKEAMLVGNTKGGTPGSESYAMLCSYFARLFRTRMEEGKAEPWDEELVQIAAMDAVKRNDVEELRVLFDRIQHAQPDLIEPLEGLAIRSHCSDEPLAVLRSFVDEKMTVPEPYRDFW